ncbi:MAG: hypothetical protein QM627_07255 [Luteolibacter sp.]
MPTHPSEDTTAPKALFESVGPMLEQCYQRTAAALYEARAGSQEELSNAILMARNANRHSQPADVIELLARIRGIEDEQLAAAIGQLSEQAAACVTPYQPGIPFADKLIIPGAFYDAFPALKTAAKYLKTPVIYAEDADAIGIASINPIATRMLGELIAKTVHGQTAIRPFISLVRTDYDVWVELNHKHFER